MLGGILVRHFPDGNRVHGRIVEVEAYDPDDPACHGNKSRTKRNDIMFGVPGLVYVYFTYGMHYCMNLVTWKEDVPSAVLIRALEVDGEPDHRKYAGPAKLCKALDIDLALNGTVLGAEQPLNLIRPIKSVSNMVQTTRIGISRGQELPWRWYDDDSSAVSKKAPKQ